MGKVSGDTIIIYRVHMEDKTLPECVYPIIMYVCTYVIERKPL